MCLMKIKLNNKSACLIIMLTLICIMKINLPWVCLINVIFWNQVAYASLWLAIHKFYKCQHCLYKVNYNNSMIYYDVFLVTLYPISFLLLLITNKTKCARYCMTALKHVYIGLHSMVDCSWYRWV